MSNKEDIIPFIVAGVDLPKALSYGEQEAFGILFVLSLCRVTELLPLPKKQSFVEGIFLVCLSICLSALTLLAKSINIPQSIGIIAVIGNFTLQKKLGFYRLYISF